MDANGSSALDQAATVARLAALDPLSRDREIKTEAKRLGCRVATLDYEIRKATILPRNNGHAQALADEIISEGSVADAFAAAHANELRFCHHTNRWYLWDGNRWKPEETRLAYRWAHQKAKELAEVDGDFRVAIAAGKATFAGGVERLAQSDRAFAVTSEIWDTDPWLLGTPGGTVELKTCELRTARQGDFITRMTAVAPAETPDCPMWLAFLHQVCGGDAGYIRFLRQWCGYSLSGITREHALIFLHGSGGNGKTVFLNTVSHILGDYAATASMDTFIACKGDRHPTGLAALRGARMVAAAETEEGRAWSETRIKQLTGGDKIAARFMRQDFFEFLPQFKLTIVGNHQPQLRNVDDAARRRINMAPFLHKPETPDPELETKLRLEAPGILRWMMEGAIDWQKHGLIRPAVVEAATTAYFGEQDLVAQWIAEGCETSSPGNPVKDTFISLLTNYRNFVAARGDEPIGSKGFSQLLTSRGFTPAEKVGKAGRGFLGIQVRVFHDLGE